MSLKRIQRYQGGFTLIEMVIVIAVIGILMGIAFNGISGIQQNARDTKRIADLRKVQTYLELYFNRCGYYPNGQECGKPAGTSETSLPWGALKTALSAIVNESDIPNDPTELKQGPYVYAFGTGGLEYVVGAKMEKTLGGGMVKGTVYTIDCDKYYCIRS